MPAELDAEARDRALEALASGSSKAEAARRSGYSRMHIHRLLEDPEFRIALEKREAELDDEEGSGRADAREALAFLRKVVAGQEDSSKEAAPGLAVRVSAAKALLAAVSAAAASKKPARRTEAAEIVKLPEPGDDEAAAAAWRQRTR